MLEKLNKGVRYWREDPLPVSDLIEISFQLKPAKRNLFEKPISNLPLDGSARKYRKPKTGNQGFFDRFGAAELHNDPQELFRLIASPGQQSPNRAKRSGSPLPGYKAFLPKIPEINRLETTPRMVLRHCEDHFVFPDLVKGEPSVFPFEADKADLHLSV
jgi:hypothetical protein